MQQPAQAVGRRACWADFGLSRFAMVLSLVFATDEPSSRSQSGIPPPKGSARALFPAFTWQPPPPKKKNPYRKSSSTPFAAIRPPLPTQGRPSFVLRVYTVASTPVKF